MDGKTMKKLLSIVLASVIAAVFTASIVSAQDLVIRWGTSPGYEPFIYKNADGSLTGFDYEIGAALCAEMNAECSWVEQAWDGIIPGLLAENYDAILGSMSITPDRQEVIDFTVKYQQGVERFVAKKDATYEDTPEGLAGVKIGVQLGTTAHDYLKAVFPDADIKTYPSQDEVWLDLAAGRIDASLVGAIPGETFLTSDAGADFAQFGEPHDDPQYFGVGAGIGVRKGEEELRDAISEAILAIRANGEYAKINARYFSVDIYGEE